MNVGRAHPRRSHEGGPGRPRRLGRSLSRLLLALALAGAPGCLIGSPLAAFSGEPYGMTVDDVYALQGRNGRIWSDAPGFAAIDLPIAAVLDTGFLPIALPIWAIKALVGGGGAPHPDRDHGYDHEHGDHGHGHDHSHGGDRGHEHDHRHEPVGPGYGEE